MTEEQSKANQIETWCVLEVFGHTKLAGFVRTVALGTSLMFRIDVPELPDREEEYTDYEYTEHESKAVKKKRTIPAVPAFTRFYGVSAIFSLTPVSEEVARAMQENMRVSPPTVVTTMRSLPSPAFIPGIDNDPPNDFDDETSEVE